MDEKFLINFKKKTELYWGNITLNPIIYGFQFQTGTQWYPGLTEEQVSMIESEFDVLLPHDYKLFLKQMNGTDKETLNVYGSSGEEHQESVGFYSFPRDTELMWDRINDLENDRVEVFKELTSQGVEIPNDSKFLPVYVHRFLVCTGNPNESMVCSIQGTDAIVYGDNFEQYLLNEFEY